MTAKYHLKENLPGVDIEGPGGRGRGREGGESEGGEREGGEREGRGEGGRGRKERKEEVKDPAKLRRSYEEMDHLKARHGTTDRE